MINPHRDENVVLDYITVETRKAMSNLDTEKIYTEGTQAIRYVCPLVSSKQGITLFRLFTAFIASI